MGGGVSVVEVREIPPLRSVREWVAFALLKTTATVALFHGLSMVVSVVPLFKFASDSPGLEAAAYAALWIAVGFVLAGGFARYLGRTAKVLFPNERLVRTEPAAFGAWTLVLAATLVLLPASTFQELAPLRSLWRDMLGILQDNHVFDGILDSPQFSGVILAPIGATLLVPIFEIVTEMAFVASSLALLLLLWARSFRFPRAYLICLLLQAALVFASVYGADLAGDVAKWVASEAGRTATHMRTTEVVAVLGAVQRYDAVLHSTALALAWTFVGYALWLPVLLRWRRAQEAFAVDTGDPLEAAAAAQVPSAFTAPAGTRGFAAGAAEAAHARPEDVTSLSPEARRRFYEDAARQLQTAGAAVSVRKGMRLGLVWAAIGVVFMMFALLRAFTQVGALHRPG